MIGWSNMSAGQSFGFTVTQYAENTDFSNLTGKENEIAILTDTKISQWRCLSSLPSNPVTNEAIIIVGKDVDIAVPALKKQNITIYPYYVMQYISGEWVNKISKIYQGGVWVDLNYILFSNGFKAADWEINTSAYNDINYQSYMGNAGKQGCYVSNIIYIENTNGGCWSGCYVGTRNNIQKKIYTTLNFNLTLTNPGTSATGGAWLMLASTKEGNLNGKTYLIKQLLTSGTITVDISSITNNFYIFFIGGYNCSSGGQNTKISLTKVWLS